MASHPACHGLFTYFLFCALVFLIFVENVYKMCLVDRGTLKFVEPCRIRCENWRKGRGKYIYRLALSRRKLRISGAIASEAPEYRKETALYAYVHDAG